MVNISVTSSCNRSCSFCFAKNTMDQAPSARMSLEQYEETLQFIDRNGLGEARILGGEPTTHPQFNEFVDLAIERGLSVIVFSGGLIPTHVLDRLSRLTADQLCVVLNVALPGEGTPQEFDRQYEVMSVLKDRLALGINIHSPDVDLMHLLDLIDQYDLARHVRLGLTHPMLDGDNVHLHPRYFDEVGSRVADFCFAAQQANVGIDFDCGWVPCMFPEDSLASLGIAPEDIGLRCNPILDVLPEGEVISCYPMADYHREKLSAWDQVDAMGDRFTERLSNLRPVGIFKKCGTCDIRERGECSGGCISLANRRLRGCDFEISVEPDSQPIEKSTYGIGLPVIGQNNGGCCGDTNRPTKQQEHGCGSCGCSTTATPATVRGNRPNQVIPLQSIHPVENREVDDGRCSESVTPWSLPYIDQPLGFWEALESELGEHIGNIYMPLPNSPIGTGRPILPSTYAQQFLRESKLEKSMLLNTATHELPISQTAPAVIEALRVAQQEYGVTSAVVANLSLAQRIRDALPEFDLTASVLMEISHPYQARMLNGVCSTLVPSSNITRDLSALEAVRAAFNGKIRLLVNEACLPMCPHRAQHFREMASGIEEPKSLCLEPLAAEPWLRLTGSWILPQHLHLLESVYDELKLAGRATLSDPARYQHVVSSYVHGDELLANEIGGGPASVLEPIDFPEELFRFTLQCGRNCHECHRCKDHYEQAIAGKKKLRPEKTHAT